MKGAKAPGFVFSALAALLAAMLLVALSPSQPPPPPIAEYAPEAVQAIKDAPPDQSAEHGLAGGGASDETAAAPEEDVADGGAGLNTTTTSTLPPNSERVRDCVRTPGTDARQTEDPQSPPCVAYFEGDNGGATARGVEPNRIKVAFMDRTNPAHFEPLLTYFNTRFETYGRRVEAGPGGCFGGGPAAAREDAKDVIQGGNFASAGYCDQMGTEQYYFDELANNGVVAVGNKAMLVNESKVAANHPYQWLYLPTFDKGMRHLSELACSLKDDNAEHGGAEVVVKPRKFGVLTNSYTDAPTPDYTPALAALDACGIEPLVQAVQVERGSEATGYQQQNPETLQQVSNAVVSWRAQDVTSIIVLTHVSTTTQLLSVLDGQGFQPEILVSTYLYNDEDAVMAAQPVSQTSHMFGVTVRNKTMRQVDDEFFYRAVQETAPQVVWDYAPNTYYGARWNYYMMLVLFSGIQLAGPHLTPESFAAGLMRAKWPNPPHKNTPGKVTVSAGTHSFMEDASIIWFSPTEASEDYATRSGFCYVDNGKRRRLGQYGNADPGVFQGPCGRD
jgi:hypothetical protein